MVVSFSTSAIFSDFNVFSVEVAFTVKKLIIGNLVYVKVFKKVPFYLLNKFDTKIALSFIR